MGEQTTDGYWIIPCEEDGDMSPDDWVLARIGGLFMFRNIREVCRNYWDLSPRRGQASDDDKKDRVEASIEKIWTRVFSRRQREGHGIRPAAPANVSGDDSDPNHAQTHDPSHIPIPITRRRKQENRFIKRITPSSH